jgi:hypothetical protein
MDVEEVWNIFLPLPKRSNHLGCYRNLKGYRNFTPEQKGWLCEEIAKVHDILTMNNKKITAKSLSERYHIPRTTIQDWYKKYKLGQPLTSWAAIVMWDEESLEYMKKENVAADRAKRPWTKDQMTEVARAQRLCTAERRELGGGKKVCDRDREMPCPKVLKKMKEDQGIITRRGQTLSNARKMACSDPRMSYSWYLVLEALASDLAAEYKWNADATTFEILKDDTRDTYYCVYENERKDKRVQYSAEDGSSGSKLPIYIKWMAMTNAVGDMSPVVLIVATDIINKDEESFFFYEVKGLTNSRYYGTGYVLFCSSRGGNKAMWRWYYLNMVVPTIAQYQIYYNLKVLVTHIKNILSHIINNYIHFITIYILQHNDGRPMRPFFSTDGEAIIIHQSLEDDVQQAFKDNSIDYVKGGASTTGIHNALDRTVVFRDMRAGIKVVNKDGIPPRYSILQNNIDSILSNLEIVSGNNIGSEYKKSIKFGLTAIVHCLQNGYCLPQQLSHGFTCCGQHVFDNSEGEKASSTIHFGNIMKQCYTDLTLQQLEHMKICAPALIQVLLQNGEIKEADYDQFDIPKLPDEDYEVRDELVLHRQRCVILTHKDTVVRFREHVQIKADANNPEFRSHMAVLHKHLKKVNSNNIKELERKRVDSLPPAEKLEETNKRKSEAAKKRSDKVAKEKESAAELAAALKFMNGKEAQYDILRQLPAINQNDMDVER